MQSNDLALEYVPAQNLSDQLPLFLVHGWGHSRACWQPLRQELSRERDLYLVDLPGFGDSAKCQLPDLDDCLDRLAALLPEPCVLIGWSLGGHLALRLAARHPEKVAGLVTLAAAGSFVAREHWPHAMPAATFGEFADAFRQDAATTHKRFCGLQSQGDREARALLKQLRAECTAPSREQETQWQKALSWLGHLDNTRDLPQLRLPMLHLFGEADALVPVATAEQLRSFSSGEVRILSAAGHAFHLTQSEPVLKHLLAFLSRPSLQPAKIDKTRMARAFSRAADSYDSVAHVQTRVGESLLAVLPPVVNQSVLDLGCGTGFCTDHLKRAGAAVTGLDIAPGMLARARAKIPGDVRWVCADAEQLPFTPAQFDGVVSNLTVQWSQGLPQLFRGLARTLRPGGWLAFSTLGPDTLHELRSAWRAVDDYTHVNHFSSEHELHEALAAAGLRVERFAVEVMTPRYGELRNLMRELKALGAQNANHQQNRGLTGPRQLRAMSRAYERYRDADGSVPATYQVFYLLVRKPD